MIAKDSSSERLSTPTADAAAYSKMIADRLSSQGYALEYSVPAEEEVFREYLKAAKTPCRYSSAELGGDYLLFGKKLTYSPISLIGFVETDVLLASIPKVQGELIRPFSERAFATAVCRKTRFAKGILPVVFQQIIPIILADESDSSVDEYFVAEKPRFDPAAKFICYPAVYVGSKRQLTIHLQSLTMAGLHFAAAKKVVQVLVS